MYQQSLLQARTAAANNFDALFTAQHYLSGPAAAMMQPLVLLANLAAEAKGLYLGTALYLLPLHHPVAVAEQTATKDIICGGKFLFGVGQGYRDQEFQSFGIRKRDHRFLSAPTSFKPSPECPRSATIGSPTAATPSGSCGRRYRSIRRLWGSRVRTSEDYSCSGTYVSRRSQPRPRSESKRRTSGCTRCTNGGASPAKGTTWALMT